MTIPTSCGTTDSLISWTYAFAAVLFAIGLLHSIYKALYQMREGRLLQTRKLRWEQSREARSILDDMEDDEHAVAAMTMLDWDGREVSVGGVTFRASYEQVDHALRTDDENFATDEVLIRDCFDHLLYFMERLGLWIEVELISVYDVVFPLGYLADLMAGENVRRRDRREVFQAFTTKYGYSRALGLLVQFKSWGGELSQSSKMPCPRAPTLWERVARFLAVVDPPAMPDISGRIGN
jgi:hypothetical protein